MEFMLKSAAQLGNGSRYFKCKKLAINLIEVIIQWRQKYLKESNAAEDQNTDLCSDKE